MTAQETKLLNAFETTLNATAGASDLTFTVSAVIDAASNTLTAPCYLVLNPDSATNREVILITSINPGTKTLTCDNINKRFLTGSAATSGLSHSSGAVVRVSPVQQHIEDINDRVDTIINEAGTAVNTSLFLDEDDMVSDSATKGVTQQSVKAYVDNNITAQDLDLADGDGNTGAVDLDSQSLTLQGTANESTVALSGQTYTIGLPSPITVNVTGQVSDISNHSTTDLSEGTNLYYTTARFDTAFSGKSTTDLSEGTNLYYTTTRANTDIDARVTKSFVDALNVDADTLDGNDSTAFATAAQGTLADSAVQPGDNISTLTNDSNFIDLTDLSVTDSGGDGSLSYNNATGVITYTGPSQAEVLAHISGGTGITISGAGVIATTITQYADSDVEAYLSGGTGVSFSSGVISIGQAVSTTSDVTFNDVTVSGDLIVSGTTTTINTETIELADNIILFNSNATGSASQDAGIEIERGDDANKTLIWNETDDKWTVGSETFVAGTFEGDLTGNVTGDLTGNVTGTVSSIANHDTDSLSEGSTNLYYTTTRFDTAFGGKSTSDLSEGTNLYYTTARFDSAFSGKNTDNLSEGSTNLYFTEERVDDRVNALLTAGSNITLTYDDVNNTLTITGEVEDNLSNNDTDDLSEGSTNLYYTDTRVNSAFDTRLATKDTDDLSEGSTNLYYTTTRANTDFNTQLATKSTTDLSEGTNLYFTNARADARIALANLEDLSNIGFTSPGASEDQKVVTWDDSAGSFALSSVSGLSGSGETNTASNIGTAGVGIFYAKVGEDLQFKKLNAGSAKITITDDTSNNEVDINLGTVSIDDLSDVDITTSAPTSGQALKWDGTNFVPGDASSAISQLSDVTLTSLANGEIIRYNGSAWVNVALSDTDDLTEGSSNLYYTTSRQNTDFDTRLATKDTDNLSEGSTNLYFTNARVDTEIDNYLSGGTGVTYSGGTISIGQAVATSSDEI